MTRDTGQVLHGSGYGFGHFVLEYGPLLVLILMIHPGILPPFKRYFHPDGHWISFFPTGSIHHVVRQGLMDAAGRSEVMPGTDGYSQLEKNTWSVTIGFD